MLRLPDKWAASLTSQPETGMGYQVAMVRLTDGTQYSEVVVQGGFITSVAGSSQIPFAADQIVSISVTPNGLGS
jgi:hypothetical protein